MPGQDLTELINRFGSICSQEPRIQAAFLGGSLVSGNEDTYSDLDLYVITNTEDHQGFFADRREFLSRLAKPVFLEDFNDFGFDMLIFILENGIQGELALAPADNFQSIHAGPYKILVDKPGLLRNATFPIERPSWDQQVETIRRNVQWFWRELSLACVALHRDQRWTAHQYLENASQRLANLVRIKHDFNNWAGGYEKIEAVVPRDELGIYEAAFSSLNEKAMLLSTRNLIESYKNVSRKLCEHYHLPYPANLEKTVEKAWESLFVRIK